MDGELVVGSVYRIDRVHHPVFSNRIGQEIVIVSKGLDGWYWASDNKPVSYRKNRHGLQVVASDPRCVRSLYQASELTRVDSPRYW